MIDWKTVVKGSSKIWTVVLTNPDGWNSNEHLLTWKMLTATEATPTTAAVTVTVGTAAITTVTNTNDTLTLTFTLSNANSDLLSAGRYLVELESAAADGTSERYWDEAAGEFTVRDPYGGG